MTPLQATGNPMEQRRSHSLRINPIPRDASQKCGRWPAPQSGRWAPHPQSDRSANNNGQLPRNCAQHNAASPQGKPAPFLGWAPRTQKGICGRESVPPALSQVERWKAQSEGGMAARSMPRGVAHAQAREQLVLPNEPHDRKRQDMTHPYIVARHTLDDFPALRCSCSYSCCKWSGRTSARAARAPSLGKLVGPFLGEEACDRRLCGVEPL